MKRLRWLDWARGVAVFIMMMCHTFNCFTLPSARQETGYLLSQEIGGMASVLFLFMAGMTFAFQMSSGDRRGESASVRWRTAMRRALYLLALAYGFRFTNWAFYYPHGNWQGIFKVDILNCMGLAMAVLGTLALFRPSRRAWIGGAMAVGFAAGAPLIGELDWSWAPQHLYKYVVPQTGAFALFPFGAYMAVGLAAGFLVRERVASGLGPFVRRVAVLGVGMVVCGRWLWTQPYTPYAHVDRWMNSPAMTTINSGFALLLLVTAYSWERWVAGAGWNWLETLGKQSLMVYFVHIMLVYGWLFETWKGHFEVWQSAAATVVLTLAMIALAQARIWQQEFVRARMAMREAVPSSVRL